MTFWVELFGDAVSSFDKVLAVLLPLIASMTAIFAVNRIIFRTNNVVLGFCAGAAAFTYFYVVHPQQDPLTTIVQVAMYFPSLANMILMVCGPIVTGMALNKSIKAQPMGAGTH